MRASPIIAATCRGFVAGARLGAINHRQIGKGGMGEVIERAIRGSGVMSPMTFCRANWRRIPIALGGSRREARILASLEPSGHPSGNLIGLEHGIAEGPLGARYSSDRSPCTHSELVDGETLADRLAFGPLPATRGRSTARQIADALAAAHGKGIVHRDLKPANIKHHPRRQWSRCSTSVSRRRPSSTTLTA